jgi:hypothetical protein
MDFQSAMSTFAAHNLSFGLFSSLEALNPCPNKETPNTFWIKVIKGWDSVLEVFFKPMLKDDEIP